MAWSNNRTHVRWSSRQHFLVLTFVIIYIPLTIVALVILRRSSANLSNQAVHIKPLTVAFSFNVTYVLVDESIRSFTEFNLNSVDRVKLARDFEYGLGLSVQNVLKIHNISPVTIIGKKSKSRHKRFVKCDPNGAKGPALIFDFNLTYPIDHMCKDEKCINQTFDAVSKKFRSVPSLSIDFENVSREIRLCSMDISPPSTTIQPSRVPTSSLSTTSYTRTSTTVYVSNEDPTLNASVSNATMSYTETSTISVPSTTNTITTSESLNSTSNQTISNITTCLEKISMTQEQVPPCRILHTSTLFFQDDRTLVVIGASKFETIIDMQIIKRQIIIDGVMLYTNCQRILDTSSPVVCYPSTSS
ncbi:unnamed protein product [Rotaria sp. Silwood1]|nr:unnamed protein product [Rotaria sp. Silwood1]CAF4727949.1 unnamed protein product [Rotaria sp. Silwood1]